jgi:hypothetical protein
VVMMSSTISTREPGATGNPRGGLKNSALAREENRLSPEPARHSRERRRQAEARRRRLRQRATQAFSPGGILEHEHLLQKTAQPDDAVGARHAVPRTTICPPPIRSRKIETRSP